MAQRLNRNRLATRVGRLESAPAPRNPRIALRSCPRGMYPCMFDSSPTSVFEHVRAVFNEARPDESMTPGWTERQRLNWHLLHRVALKARPSSGSDQIAAKISRKLGMAGRFRAAIHCWATGYSEGNSATKTDVIPASS